MIKRLFDILFSLIFLFVTFPAMAIISLVVFFDLSNPIIFRQERIGKDGKKFNFIKFRTMRNTYDKSGQLLDDKERLTKVGRFLRKTSLDEFPSFWNVLTGKMSIVGPRPLLIEYLNLFSEFELKRHNVRPGITGWAQINGRNSLTWKKKFELDIWYVNNHSFWLDLKIIIYTIPILIFSNDINNQNHETMYRYKSHDEKKR